MTSSIRALVRINVVKTLVLFLSFSVHAQLPTHTPKFNFIDNNINGYWEYLPSNYNSETNSRYPLLIFMHGAGDSGANPDIPTLRLVLNTGIPKIIESGGFPQSLTVGSQQFKFLVLSPQIKAGFDYVTRSSIIAPSTIEAVINYAKNNYRVDQSRIYLCGLSMGAGAIWQYASSSTTAARQLAAIVVAAGAADLTTAQATTIATSNLAVLATHNNVDQVISADRTRANLVKIISNKPADNQPPLGIFWNTAGEGINSEIASHNVWSRTFEDLQPGTSAGGNVRDSLGVSALEWMLQFASIAALPVTWEAFNVTESNGNVFLEWKVSQEKQVKKYEVQKSANGTQWNMIASLDPKQDNGLIKIYNYTDANANGENYYRIGQIDLDGKFSYSMVRRVTLSSTANFKVYPNPFKNQLNITVNGYHNQLLAINLISSDGTIVRSEKGIRNAAGQQITLQNLEKLSKGMYYITVLNDKGEVLLKEKLIRN